MEKNKRTLFFLSFLLFLGLIKNSSAQSFLLPIPSCPTQYTCLPRLQFPSADSLVYASIYQRIEQLIFEGQEDKITILHIGGSHIQAGTFSNRVRSDLLTMFPNLVSSRGLVVPFSAAKTNNPSNYTTLVNGKWEMAKATQRQPAYPMGLSALTVVPTSADASIGIVLSKNDSINFLYNTVYVLAYSDSNWVFPKLRLKDSLFLDGTFDTLNKWYRFDLPYNLDTLVMVLNCQDSLWQDFYLRGFFFESQLPGLTYVDIGINGASVPSYLKCNLLQTDLKLINPDLCIFSIGINDASGTDFDTTVFIRHYKELISRISEVAPDCKFLFTTNNDSYRKASKRYYNNPNGYLAQQSFWHLAAYYHCGLFDLFDYMGGLKSMALWEKENLAKKDKIHFTPKGYFLIADLLYNAIAMDFEQYLLKKNKHGME